MVPTRSRRLRVGPELRAWTADHICDVDYRAWYADDREEAHLQYVALTPTRHVLHPDAARRAIERGRPLRELPPRPQKRPT